MSNPSGAPSVVMQQNPAQNKPKKPINGETKLYHDHEGNLSFEVKFKGDTVTVKKVGKPDVTRGIVNKYGNIRKVDGQMKQAADDALWYLFGLTENN